MTTMTTAAAVAAVLQHTHSKWTDSEWEEKKNHGEEQEQKRKEPKKQQPADVLFSSSTQTIRLQPLFVLRYNACATAAIVIITSLRFRFYELLLARLDLWDSNLNEKKRKVKKNTHTLHILDRLRQRKRKRKKTNKQWIETSCETLPIYSCTFNWHHYMIFSPW